jgi:hypothetical protein
MTFGTPKALSGMQGQGTKDGLTTTFQLTE